MTSSDTDGLVVGAYLERDDPRDALIGAAEIRPGMRIGTASARRRAQLLALEPTLSIEPMRGNVDTRLRKLRERGLDAIVLAACGLDRLGLQDEIGARLDPERDAAGGRPGRARAAGARGRGGAGRATPTMPRRAAASSRSAGASRRSAPGASHRSPPITTGSALQRADRGRRRRAGSSGAAARIPRRSRGADRARREPREAGTLCA